jgi:hypothetical protein
LIPNTAAYTYKWNNAAIDGSTQRILVLGNYTVTITETSTGCERVVDYCTQPVNCSSDQLYTDRCNDCQWFRWQIGHIHIRRYCKLQYRLEWAQTGNSINQAAGNFTIQNLKAGAYSVTVTDKNGCTAECAFTVQGLGCTIAAVATGTNSSCFGSNDGSIKLTITGAVGNTNIVWSNAGWNGLTNIVNASPGDIFSYDYDAAGCVATESVLVGQPSEVKVSCTANPVSGPNTNDGVSIINISGGTPNYKIDWSGAQSGPRQISKPVILP